MIGSSWQSKVVSAHNKGITGLQRYGIFSSFLGGVFQRILGIEKIAHDEEERLLSTSSSSLSDAGVKK